jgi:hypothetical protein
MRKASGQIMSIEQQRRRDGSSAGSLSPPPARRFPAIARIVQALPRTVAGKGSVLQAPAFAKPQAIKQVQADRHQIDDTGLCGTLPGVVASVKTKKGGSRSRLSCPSMRDGLQLLTSCGA